MRERDTQAASAASLNSRPLPREGGWGDGSPLVGNTDDGDLKVAIIGAGPIGLALGLALTRAGIACRILDARPHGAVSTDRRVLALSQGSRQILERLGAWQGLDATPIATIHVSQQGGLGRTLLTAKDKGLPALGYVAEAGALGARLAAACAAAGAAIDYDTRVEGATAQAGHIRLACATPRGAGEIRARLAAWAEGAVDPGAQAGGRDYGQQAIVAALSTPEPHGHTAFERFTPSGPVAILPHGRHYALVWSAPAAELPGLLALDDAAFLARLQQVFGGRLRFTGVGERLAFPLGLRYRRTPVGERMVWLGNAAQTLHPVAGQGFNLGLRDVSDLALTLREHAEDCGSAATLARYAARRRLDRGGTIGFTDSLVRLFANSNPLLHHGRGAGLLALDLVPAARRFLGRRMIFGARAWP
ncbi:MAG: FAD-dependent monooxygenase [Rhodocyclales bacterium]|nr:FAD-dependent monooxygenase [Rhodocyclales bacterium]